MKPPRAPMELMRAVPAAAASPCRKVAGHECSGPALHAQSSCQHSWIARYTWLSTDSWLCTQNLHAFGSTPIPRWKHADCSHLAPHNLPHWLASTWNLPLTCPGTCPWKPISRHKTSKQQNQFWKLCILWVPCMHQAPAAPNINITKLARKPSSSAARGISLQAVHISDQPFLSVIFLHNTQRICTLSWGKHIEPRHRNVQAMVKHSCAEHSKPWHTGLHMSMHAHLDIRTWLQSKATCEEGAYSRQMPAANTGRQPCQWRSCAPLDKCAFSNMATAAGAKTAVDSNATLLSCHPPVSSPARHYSLQPWLWLKSRWRCL